MVLAVLEGLQGDSRHTWNYLLGLVMDQGEEDVGQTDTVAVAPMPPATLVNTAVLTMSEVLMGVPSCFRLLEVPEERVNLVTVVVVVVAAESLSRQTNV